MPGVSDTLGRRNFVITIHHGASIQPQDFLGKLTHCSLGVRSQEINQQHEMLGEGVVLQGKNVRAQESSNSSSTSGCPDALSRRLGARKLINIIY